MKPEKIIFGFLLWMAAFSVFAVDEKSAMVKELNDPVTTSSILQVIFGLIVVLMIIGISAYMLRRFGRFSTMDNGIVKVITSLSMGARERIVLLQVGEKQILVGLSAGRMQTLCELDTPVVIDESDSTLTNHFSDKLISAIRRNHSFDKKH